MTNRFHRLELALFVLILVIGASLRLVALDRVPPGLTHDEADHGMDAIGVLEGRTPIYFTVGYGREPLFDYVTALVMLVIGRSFLASRLTAALFGIALLILVYAWVRLATRNNWLALATMAGLSLSFWGISTSRQALRSETLPVLYMAAALAMRRGIRVEEDIPVSPRSQRPQAEMDQLVWFVLGGVFLGLSIYTYLAARIMWLVFPAFFLLLAITQPGVIRKAWPGLIIMLAVGAVVASPLILYLIQNPSAEVRISQLSGPINSLMAGDLEPLRQNLRAGLASLTIRGDDLWLYNIPGRPLLGPVMSLLFYLGITVAVLSIFYPYRPARRGRASYDDTFRISSANGFMLLTLMAGLVPAIITGVGASSTRIIGMQPALYYFPALASVWLAQWAYRQVGNSGVTAIWTAFGILVAITGLVNSYAYFVVWANARDVRVAYHTTLVETLHYLDAHPEIGPEVALSTITPGRFHDPSVAGVALQRDDLRLRWFDGRSSLVLMNGPEGVYIFPEIAPLAESLQSWLAGRLLDRLALRPGDFNREVAIVSAEPHANSTAVQAAVGNVLELLSASISTPRIQPGEALTVQTVWRIAAVPDSEIIVFTHALDQGGQVVAQHDFLGMPTSSWVAGDLFVQLHILLVPNTYAPGTLVIEIGAYTLPDIVRLPIFDPDGNPAGDHLIIGSVEVP